MLVHGKSKHAEGLVRERPPAPALATSLASSNLLVLDSRALPATPFPLRVTSPVILRLRGVGRVNMKF